jgi:hypothetical protein
LVVFWWCSHFCLVLLASQTIFISVKTHAPECILVYYKNISRVERTLTFCKTEGETLRSVFSSFDRIILHAEKYKDFESIIEFVFFVDIHIPWKYWNIAEYCFRALMKEWESWKSLRFNFEKYVFIRFSSHPFENC